MMSASSHSPTLFIVVLLVGLLAATLTRYFLASQRPKGFPAGPPTAPFIGNLHQLPSTKAFLKFHEWRKEYGNIIGLKFGPQNVVVLNTYKHVKELFDKKGGIYSSRPDNFIANTLICPNNVHILLVPYNSGWRKLRKCVQQLLNVTAVDRLRLLQASEACQTIHDLIRAPEDYYDHLRRYSTSVVLASVFGQRGETFASEKVQSLYHVQNQFTEMIEPGATPPVDAFPILKYLPDFLAAWKTKAKSIRHEQRELYFALLEDTKKKMANGEAGNCFLASLIAEQEKNGFSDEEIAYIGGILMEAGSDTTASTLLAFCLAMASYPEVLTKCQTEVDRLCPNQSPTIADIDSLPYLRACMTEVLRWRPVAAGGIPHVVTQDDIYEGYLIPKGTMLFANTYAIHHDPNEYENPSEFIPERFVNNKFGIKSENLLHENDGRRVTYGFGAGRRICPGQRLSENSLMINIAKLVWTFNISATEALDTNIETGFSDGILLCPKEFAAKFTLRDAWRASTIETEFKEAKTFLKQFK